MTTIVFTDLDGTLLDRDDYSYEAALPVLAMLEERRIPLVLVTSKTRAETERWRARLHNTHPFIVENGGAAFIPTAYFDFRPPRTLERDGYWVIEWGWPYAMLTKALRNAAGAGRCPVRGFHQMTPEELAAVSSLPVAEARLALAREYTEPFEILRPESAPDLQVAIRRAGLRLTRGGRFWHLSGPNDKALAVIALLSLYRRQFGEVRSIGLGDGPNDIDFLKIVSAAAVVRSPLAGTMTEQLPNALLTKATGPAGWSEAMEQLLPV